MQFFTSWNMSKRCCLPSLVHEPLSPKWFFMCFSPSTGLIQPIQKQQSVVGNGANQTEANTWKRSTPQPKMLSCTSCKKEQCLLSLSHDSFGACLLSQRTFTWLILLSFTINSWQYAGQIFNKNVHMYMLYFPIC